MTRSNRYTLLNQYYQSKCHMATVPLRSIRAAAVKQTSAGNISSQKSQQPCKFTVAKTVYHWGQASCLLPCPPATSAQSYMPAHWAGIPASYCCTVQYSTRALCSKHTCQLSTSPSKLCTSIIWHGMLSPCSTACCTFRKMTAVSTVDTTCCPHSGSGVCNKCSTSPVRAAHNC